MAAFNYADPQWNWDSLTYNSKGGGQKIKSVAARQGATYEGAMAAWGKPGGAMNVTGYNPNIAKVADGQDAALSNKLGLTNSSGTGTASKPAITFGQQPKPPSPAMGPATQGFDSNGKPLNSQPTGAMSPTTPNRTLQAVPPQGTFTMGTVESANKDADLRAGVTDMEARLNTLLKNKADVDGWLAQANGNASASGYYNQSMNYAKEIDTLRSDISALKRTITQPAAMPAAPAPNTFGSGTVRPPATSSPSGTTNGAGQAAPPAAKPAATFVDPATGQTTYRDPKGSTFLTFNQFVELYGYTPDGSVNKTRGAFGGNNAAGQAQVDRTGGPVPSVENKPVPQGMMSGGNLPNVSANGAPTFSNPYAGMTSQLQGLENPYDAAYARAAEGRVIDRVEEQRLAASNVARSRAANRGLMSGGDSGILAGDLGSIDNAAFSERVRGLNDATMNTANQRAGYGLQRAQGLDSFGMNQASGTMSAERSQYDRWKSNTLLPYEAAGMMLGNESRALGNQAQQLDNDFTTATIGDRAALVRAEVDASGIRNERARFELDNTRQVAPLQQQAASLELIRLQQAITQAERAGDRQLAQDLGEVAGRVAAAGGFKWIGAGVGAVVGSVIPGAGTVAGGGVGGTIGGWLDSALAPKQNGR